MTKLVRALQQSARQMNGLALQMNILSGVGVVLIVLGLLKLWGYR